MKTRLQVCASQADVADSRWQMRGNTTHSSAMLKDLLIQLRKTFPKRGPGAASVWPARFAGGRPGGEEGGPVGRDGGRQTMDGRAAASAAAINWRRRCLTSRCGDGGSAGVAAAALRGRRWRPNASSWIALGYIYVYTVYIPGPPPPAAATAAAAAAAAAVAAAAAAVAAAAVVTTPPPTPPILYIYIYIYICMHVCI